MKDNKIRKRKFKSLFPHLINQVLKEILFACAGEMCFLQRYCITGCMTQQEIFLQGKQTFAADFGKYIFGTCLEFLCIMLFLLVNSKVLYKVSLNFKF